MSENNDISKIIGIIMENPDIIERIKSLANNKQETADVPTVISETKDAPENTIPIISEVSSAEVVKQAASPKKDGKGKRSALLLALKPYLSTERSRAVETMLSVMDILDIVKEK